MKMQDDKLIFESRDEIDLMQNICEGFIALSKSQVEDEEKELAKQISGFMDAMYMSW